MKANDIKIGQIVYYIDNDNNPAKTIVNNISSNNSMINFCECDECNERIGTQYEHWKYDYAIPISSLFESADDLEIALNSILRRKINLL